jgi:hypothetical protein
MYNRVALTRNFATATSGAITLLFTCSAPISQVHLVQVRIDFEPFGCPWTIKVMMYYSNVQLYTFKQKILGRGESDSLSIVYSYDLKKYRRHHTILYKKPISEMDILVENIPISMWWSLNHCTTFCLKRQGNCSCLRSNLRSYRAGLKPLR